MKRASKQSYNIGNLRASSSNNDNFRNQGLKKITNNLIPDTYYFRNNNYINIKFDKFNNINSSTNKNCGNKKYAYNIIQPQTQSTSKHKINFGRVINGISDEIRELSKSIERSENNLRKIEERNFDMNINIKNSKYLKDLNDSNDTNNTHNKNNEIMDSYVYLDMNKENNIFV